MTVPGPATARELAARVADIEVRWRRYTHRAWREVVDGRSRADAAWSLITTLAVATHRVRLGDEDDGLTEPAGGWRLPQRVTNDLAIPDVLAVVAAELVEELGDRPVPEAVRSALGPR
jgi:hypothetical protein